MFYVLNNTIVLYCWVLFNLWWCFFTQSS